MFHTGDERLRAIEQANLRWRRRILGGFIRRLGRAMMVPLRAALVALVRRFGTAHRRCRTHRLGCPCS